MADGEDVYCTLVMTDAYLPGAAVLAHSLRDAGTTRKLACLILQDSLRSSTVEELQSLYNYVIPIERIGNPSPANLYLMGRPDLLYTFTKIQLWRQTLFRKIVYLDADVVALRAPDELFDISESFAAAPDVGWPDIFNTGVMVLSPHMGDYHALRGMAEAGDSFDGADQGLINQYYEHRAWKRLSFTYNTTPNANYQYEPAYRYYKRDIAIVHFIGGEKPWSRGRSAHNAPSAFQEMLSRWWAVYDRHFSVTGYIHGQRQLVSQYVTGGKSEPAENIDQGNAQPPPTVEQSRFFAPHMQWDATRGAPPIESRPEAPNFPSQVYEFNTDTAPFRPPPSYPEPPRDMWYNVPPAPKKEEKLAPLFPWEEREHKPSRRFIEDEVQLSLPVEPDPELEPYADELEVSSGTKIEPLTPTIRLEGDSPWTAFNSNKNAWDEVTGIEDYVRALTAFQKNRGNVQVIQEDAGISGQVQEQEQDLSSPSREMEPAELVDRVKERRESLILTDFPSAIERPSLPVTPAPRQRPNFWGDERDEEGDLPGAEGVPDQAEWDPNAQLEELRRNSLLGPGDLKLPDRQLSKRGMPAHAVPIPEEALNHPHLTRTNSDEDRGSAAQHHSIHTDSEPAHYHAVRSLGGGSSPHGLDGSYDSESSMAGLQSSMSSGQGMSSSMMTQGSSSNAHNTSTSSQHAHSSSHTQTSSSRTQSTSSNTSVAESNSFETATNTAINSGSSSLTAADAASGGTHVSRVFFSEPEFAKPAVDGIESVDEVELKRQQESQEGGFFGPMHGQMTSTLDDLLPTAAGYQLPGTSPETPSARFE